MNTRGLTEIVILTVGQGLGVISPALFAMMVLMALTTTVMATPLLGLVYPKRLQFADAETGSVRVDPSRRSTFRIMVAVVEPAEVGPVLRLAVDLRPDGKTPALILTHVVDASLVGERTAERDALALSRAEVGSLAASVVGSSSSVRVRTSLSARPGRCLADLALSDRADLVLVRWQTFGGDVSRETLLSDLIETASCDLAAVVDERVAPDWKTDGSRPIMVWLQGTVHDDAALSLATALGRGSRVALRLVLTDGAVQPGPSAGTDAGSVVRVDPTHDEWLEVFGAGSLVVMGLPGKSEVARRRFDLLTTGGLPESTLVVVRSSRARGHARSWPLPANRGPESEQFQAAGGGQ